MIYVFLAEGFEEVEALTPVDCLRRAKQEVQTVGVGGRFIVGSHGIPVAADISTDEMVLDDAVDMIVLPGGMPGTLHLEKSDAVQKALTFCAEHDKLIAAICAAPSVLGKRGMLSGRKAVCYPGFEKHLTGAEIPDVPAIRDGNFITGRGPGAAMDFALLLTEAMCGAECAAQLAAGMVYTK